MSLEFDGDDPVIFAVTCVITNYNIKYDDKNFLFDFVTYESYSLCIAAPVGDSNYFNLNYS